MWARPTGAASSARPSACEACCIGGARPYIAFRTALDNEVKGSPTGGPSTRRPTWRSNFGYSATSASFLARDRAHCVAS
jgi:hypothetical protein